MRSKPFSGKQKKLQLQEKRQRKQHEGPESDEFLPTIVNPKSSFSGHKPNNLVSQWDPLGVAQKTRPVDNPEYSKPIQQFPQTCLEVSFEDVHGEINSRFTLPSRPVWSYEQTKEELEKQELGYFNAWLERIYSLCPKEELSFFEHNLEVWRQLWRVCEISDVIVIVVDARHPVLNFPPTLYEYVVVQLKKRMCLALTKTDIVGETVVAAWTKCIKEKFPEISIVNCSVYDLDSLNNTDGKRPKRYKNSFGVDNLIDLLESMTPEKFTEEWIEFKHKRKLLAEVPDVHSSQALGEKEYLTVGFLGHPNAGKSSLINSIMGRTLVSASKTPGHTKHFQTIHLTKHIRLCDCPGLIFPMKVSKWLQILAGLYNIAQVKDPYEPLMHLAMHINLPRALGLQAQGPMSILQISEDFAIQRGYYTAKAARPDIYRAANSILRSVNEGRIVLSWKPPHYYETHQDIAEPISRIKPTAEVESDSEEIETENDGNEGSSSSSVDELTGAIGGAFSLLQDEDLE